MRSLRLPDLHYGAYVPAIRPLCAALTAYEDRNLELQWCFAKKTT